MPRFTLDNSFRFYSQKETTRNFHSESVERLLQKLASDWLPVFAREKQIQEDLVGWKKMLMKINDVLDDAMKKQATIQSVNMWLAKLQNFAYDFEDLLDEFQTEAFRRKSMPGEATGQPSTSHQSGSGAMSKVNDVNARLQHIASQIVVLGLKSRNVRRRLIPTYLVTQKMSFLGKGSAAGLAMTVDALDALGSSMTNLNAGGGFISGVTSKGNRISILAFEVANTIEKGVNLFLSLSEENIQFLKKEVLHSSGVQKLVSTDMKDLLSIAAADKREELDVFLREVIRFGNLCKDPQWQNLDQYFSNLKSENFNHKQPRGETEMRMKELTALAQHTSELYHQFIDLDRFEINYQRKLEELDSLNLPRKGEGVMMLHSELKQQKKFVRSLKKKSLWSRNLEEIMVKLVNIAAYMHQAILEAFGNDGRTMISGNPSKIPERLGLAGLALHYANIINQIDNIASSPASLLPNIRDTLYNGLPATVKTTLRSRLQTVNSKRGLSACQIKGEMEKALEWLVPIATNTTKAHQGFGWVGEWANTSREFGKGTATNSNLARLQTLYHADKQKTDQYILELVIWLNHSISILRHKDHSSQPLPTRAPTQKGVVLHSKMHQILSLDNAHQIQLLQEERNLLDETSGRRLIPGISRSQEFSMANMKGTKVWALSKSTGNSPNREISGRHKLEHPKANMLDVMDGLDSWF